MRRRLSAVVTLLAMGWIAAVVSHIASEAVAAATVSAASHPVEITLRDGRRLHGSLDGVGCSETLCSRVAVRGREIGVSAVTRTDFDIIDRIVSVGGGGAEFHLKDGTVRRIGVVQDNQVLYVFESGRAQKVNLADVEAVDFKNGSSPDRPRPFSAPRTPWGDPDLQGVWSGRESLGVPLDREVAYGTRSVLTDDEFEVLRKRLVANASSGNIEATNFGAESDLVFHQSRQASLVVDPADGRRPTRTPEAEARPSGRNSFVPGPFNALSDFGLYDRCISLASFPQTFPANDLQIVQSPGFVAIGAEVIHDMRVIPLDRRPHVSGAIRSYLGDSRGWWEGSTLVVETTNLNGLTHLTFAPSRSSDRTIVAERFTLVEPDTLQYDATINDPNTWTRPWTIAFPRRRQANGVLYEYACHEGNYGLPNILSASRAAEKSASR